MKEIKNVHIDIIPLLLVSDTNVPSEFVLVGISDDPVRVEISSTDIT